MGMGLRLVLLDLKLPSAHLTSKSAMEDTVVGPGDRRGRIGGHFPGVDLATLLRGHILIMMCLRPLVFKGIFFRLMFLKVTYFSTRLSAPMDFNRLGEIRTGTRSPASLWGRMEQLVLPMPKGISASQSFTGADALTPRNWELPRGYLLGAHDAGEVEELVQRTLGLCPGRHS